MIEVECIDCLNRFVVAEGAILARSLSPAVVQLTCTVEYRKRWVRVLRQVDAAPPPSPLRAVARSTDPETSHEAAASVRHIRESQLEVLAALRQGPATDEQLVARLRDQGSRQSVSGIRTRRAELRDEGLVVDSGQRVVGSTGRRMIVWAARWEEAA